MHLSRLLSHQAPRWKMLVALLAVSACTEETPTGTSEPSRGSQERQVDAISTWPQTQYGHPLQVHAVAVSADGRHVLTGSDDHAVRVWDLSTGVEIARLLGHEDVVAAAAYLPPGANRAVTVGVDGKVRVWNVPDGRAVRSFRVDYAWGVAFSPDRTQMASGGEGAAVWGLETQERTLLEAADDCAEGPLAFDGERVATAGAGWDGEPVLSVCAWDAGTGRLVASHEWPVPFAEPRLVRFTQGGHLFVVERMGRTHLIDLETGAAVPMEGTALEGALSYSHAAGRVAVRRPLRGPLGRPEPAGLVHGNAWAGEECPTADVCGEGVEVWEVGRPTLRLPFNAIRVLLSPDGRHLLTLLENGLEAPVAIWDAGSGALVSQLGVAETSRTR